MADYSQNAAIQNLEKNFRLPDHTAIGIAVSDWNSKVTHAMLYAATKTLIDFGINVGNIETLHVPGAFELTYGAKLLSMSKHGVIVLGCVIRGETPHFEYICQGVTYGITQLNLSSNIPIVFGVLTTNNLEQALERAGGIHGNKGAEAAATLLKMLNISMNSAI